MEQNTKNNTNLKYVIIFSIIILVIIFIVVWVIPFPYKAIEKYTIQEPYTTTEYYYNQVPKTICGAYTIFGNCKSWKTIYNDVRKSRTVNKYRNVEKQREVLKKDTLFNMMVGNTKYYYEV